MKRDQVFELCHLRQEYAGRTALQIPELRIPEGCILGISGHNGSGKSTLLRLLAFLETPVHGRVVYRSQPDLPSARARRRITLLTQEPYLLTRSVAANVAYGLRVRGGLDERTLQHRVEEALEMVGLPASLFAHRSWRALSGGEAQRVALAARLVLRPDVLLLDEPTSSLDPDNAQRLLDAALLARDEWGVTLVVVSHDANWLKAVSDGVLFIQRGEVVSMPEFCCSL